MSEIRPLTRAELAGVKVVRASSTIWAAVGAPTLLLMRLGEAPIALQLAVGGAVAAAAFLSVRSTMFLRRVRRDTRQVLAGRAKKARINR